jgi:AmmeMemoRadiSam system protein A
MEFTAAQCSFLLDLARQTIRQRLSCQELPPVSADDPALGQPGSCFVTLHTLGEHRLRGCIGQIQATGPLLVSVREMAEAVLDDPRFRVDPVTTDELPGLAIEITVLSPLEPAAHPLDFYPLEDGIYLQCQGETGCFLPQVARETGWTREQLLARLCTEKMGLAANAWQAPAARLYRFTATIIGPEPFAR